MSHEPRNPPATDASERALQPGATLADRYRIVRELGRGRAAAVLEALDLQQSRRVALKQLLPQSVRRRPVLVDFFQREFQTLSQLSHPQIIRVYDYGIGELGPYYTMELLCGEDLREAAPLPWQRVCEVLLEVASSLAILHARRLLHNDVSARNVRFTAEGGTKLIDFGAMSLMGVPKYVAGTAPYVSPEAVHGQPLDGRSDLFSLGALAYWSLTSRHAFPARSHAELPERWRRAPAAPSAFASGVPDELDDLVLALLCLDPLGRPATAAAVIDRLGGILGLPPVEDPETASSFLVTPTLVGCEELIRRFRDSLERAEQGRGGAIVLEGETGRGRTRLLSRFVLEANLKGIPVLRAAGSGLERGDYRVIAALLEDLAGTLPADVLRERFGCRAAILGRLSPVLEERLGLAKGQNACAEDAAPPHDDAASRNELESAVARLVLDLAAERCLVVAVDDVQCCDARSIGVIARWAHGAAERRLVVVTTNELGTPSRQSGALEVLRQAGNRIRLQPLDADGTEALLESIFGKVENLRVVASWAHRIAGGSPGASLELARHLVDHGIAVFEGGAWRLPERLGGFALPRNLGQMFELRLAALGPDARTLARALALATEHAPLTAAACGELLGPSDDAQERASRALGDLLAQQIVEQTEEGYYVVRRGFLESLRSGLDERERKSVHAELASLYQGETEALPAIVAHHLRQSGQAAAALPWALAWVRELDWDERFDFDLLMSPLGRQILESALETAEAQGASPLDLYRLRRCLLDIALRADPEAIVHADAVGEQLRRESGLAFWDEMDDASLTRQERLARCVRRAQEIHDESPEAERGLCPLDALRAFARYASTTCAVYARTQDLERLYASRDLLLPLRDQSPVATAMHEIVGATVKAAVLSHDVAQRRRRLIETLNVPLAGIDDHARVSAQNTLIYYMALEEVALSTPDALRRADLLESRPGFEAMAWQIRRLWHLCNADAVEAARCGRQMELLAIGEVESHMALTFSLLYEVAILTAAGDSMGLKRLLPRLEEQAARFPGWQPWRHLTRGLIHQLRGEHASAHSEIRECLSRVSPQRGAIAWIWAMDADLGALVGMGALESAKASAEQSLALLSDEQRSRPFQRNAFQIPLAYADALSGEQEAAEQRIDAALAGTRDARLAPLFVGGLLEARARLAVTAGDAEAFRCATRSLEAIYGSGRYPVLTARLDRLKREAEGAGLPGSGDAPAAAGAARSPGLTPEDVRSRLDRCRGSEERADACLRILVDASGAEDGYLYTLQEGGPVIAASVRGDPPPVEIDAWVEESLSAILADVTEYSSLEPNEAELERSRAGLTLALISAPRRPNEIVAGIAVLRRTTRPVAERVLGALCDGLLSAGDVLPLVSPLH